MTNEIYKEDRMKQLPVYPTKQTPSYADWNLFEMGKELENATGTLASDDLSNVDLGSENAGKSLIVDSEGGIELEDNAKTDLSNVDLGSANEGKSLIVDSDGGVTLGDNAKADLSNVDFGSANVGKSLMVDSDGGIELGNPSFTPGSSGVVVPDTPATTHDAVNQAYVESTVDGVNNLVHKSGNESISGNKTYTGQITQNLNWQFAELIKQYTGISEVRTEEGTGNSQTYPFTVYDANGNAIFKLTCRSSDQYNLDDVWIQAYNPNASTTSKTISLRIVVNDNGLCELRFGDKLIESVQLS